MTGLGPIIASHNHRSAYTSSQRHSEGRAAIEWKLSTQR